MVPNAEQVAFVMRGLLEILEGAPEGEGRYVAVDEMPLTETERAVLIVSLDRAGIGSHIKDGLFYFHRK